MFPLGEFGLESLVPSHELAHFVSQAFIFEPRVSLSLRVRRSRSHMRFALCHQGLDVPIPTPELRHQVFIFFLDCRKLFLQLSRCGGSS